MATWTELLDPKRGKDEALELALAIVKAYGYTLEFSKGPVDQESELVFPKTVIKLSILAIYSQEESEERKRALQLAYAMLGSFQRLNAVEAAAIQRLAPSTRRMQLSDRASVNEWLVQWPKMKPVIERALNEYTALSAEFRGVVQ